MVIMVPLTVETGMSGSTAVVKAPFALMRGGASPALVVCRIYEFCRFGKSSIDDKRGYTLPTKGISLLFVRR